MYARSHKKSKTQTSTATDQNPQTTHSNATTSQNEYTLLDTPKQIDNLHLLKSDSYLTDGCKTTPYDGCIKSATEEQKKLAYYLIGTTTNGGRIVALDIPVYIDSHTVYFIEKTPGTYSLLLQHTGYASAPNNSPQAMLDSYEQSDKKFYNASVVADTTTKISESDFAKEANVNGQKLKSYGYSEFMAKGLPDIRGSLASEPAISSIKIGEDGDKKYYKVVTRDKPTFQVITIYATYKNLFSAEYTQTGEIADAMTDYKNTLNVNWTNGENDKSHYFTAGAGCGISGNVIAKNVDKSQFLSVGKTTGNQAVSLLPTTHPLVKELYDNDYVNGQGTDEKTPELKNLTIQQFSDKHAYFLVENALGDYVIYQRSDMFIRGGCGKPVVYLYPTAPTDVSVAVGADVVKSEPFYPSGGWQHVLAQPSGVLSYLGKSYDSLYWEGYGHGDYPDITSGTVVKSSDAATTIRNQLTQQGLNQKETVDFLAFWQAKLPTTGYTRLTWLSKGQLDRLAPLSIKPMPQTTIRVFLDFERLSQPVTMPAQYFKAPARKGFTVVEWGGLLRDGIH